MKKLLLAFALMGCVRDNPANNNGSSGVDPKFGASLTVETAVQTNLGATGPDGLVILVDLVLSNQGSTSLPLKRSLFSAETPQGLAFTADDATGCDGAQLVAGHSVTCHLVFQRASASAVVYTLPDQRPLRAPVQPTPCFACGSSPQCIDLSSDPNNCGQCGVKTQSCVNGVPQCGGGLAFCMGRCLDTASDDSNCGVCGHFCGAGSHCAGGACSLPSSCAGAATRNDCIDCCQAAHPTGSALYLNLFQQCLCVTPGDCALDCQTDFCSTGNIADTFCQLCIQQSTCDPTTQCRGNSDCGAYLDCALACPSS